MAYATANGETGGQTTLLISGMTCAGCAGRVEKALRAVPGVATADVNFALDTAIVSGGIASEPLIDAVSAAGFGAEVQDLLKPQASVSTNRHGMEPELIDLAIAACLTFPLLLQMVLMAAGTGFHLPPWLEFVLTTPVQFWIGRRFYTGAWKSLKSGSGTMDHLVVLGTCAAYFYSLWLWYRYGSDAAGNLYFEASAVILTLVLAGKVMEGRARKSASEALRNLMALRPERASVIKNGIETDIKIDEVQLNDRLLIRPGERLPVDGIIVLGESEIDESLITGESMPVLRKTQDVVVAGSVNGTGALEISATRIGENTTLARIAKLVEHAQSGKAPVQRLVDRISAFFVPIILAIAILTFLGWSLGGAEFETAMTAAVSVLVIACPCALGLATPTALVAGTGAAARAGILIRNIETLERAQKTDTVIFDKTGTLTEGKPTITEFISTDHDEHDLLRIAASAQQLSEHPLGKAIVNHAQAEGLNLIKPTGFKAHPGLGIEACVDGKKIRIGRSDFAKGNSEQDNQLEEQGKTLSHITIDDKWAGLFAFADTVRDDAANAVQMLKARGVEVILLTGDNKQTAQRIGKDLGITSIEAGLRPQQKVRRIKDLMSDGQKVAMVGDGANDAPALAAADVGMAMGDGSDIALEAAGITLMRPRPTLVVSAIDIAQKTSAKIHQNLFWAFIYNIVGIPVAASGLLSPALAGAAMALSSVSVVSNSLLLKRWNAGGVK